MTDLKFPLTMYEMNQVNKIEERLKESPNILLLDEKEDSAYFDVIQALKQRNILQDAGIDNCNAYFVTGDFAAFKEWIESQNEKAKQAIIPKGGIMMVFEPLTSNCEKLLLDILNHRDEKGNCDLEYWEKRFQDLSLSDDIILRSQFGILKDRKMISIQWASNVPYILFVLEDGLSYFEQKEAFEKWKQNHQKADTENKRKEYDVFISHARKDKLTYVDELNAAMRKLGVNIFYDTDVISWGDNWKIALLEGIEKSEFAIIVISNNYFDREWTERELQELFKRQNESGSKIVLPLLYGITIDDMKDHYPFLSEIQVLEEKNYTKEEIVILFARELIKRLK